MRGYNVTAIDRQDGTNAATGVLARIGAEHRSVATGLEALGSSRFDLMIEATGSAVLDLGLVGLLGKNGVLVLTGIPDATQAPTPVAAGALWRNVVLQNQAVVGSVNANRSYFEAGVRDLTLLDERWPGAVASLVTARHRIEDFADVFSEHAPGSMKTALTIQPGSAGSTAP
jgi:threonine dehydrogenase-like Zn-dependent dehydrogenase